MPDLIRHPEGLKELDSGFRRKDGSFAKRAAYGQKKLRIKFPIEFFVYFGFWSFEFVLVLRIWDLEIG